MEAGDAFPSGFIRTLIYRDCFVRHGYDVRYASRLYPPLRRFMETPPAFLRAALRGSPGRLVFQLERLLARLNEAKIVSMARRADVVYMSKVTSYRLVEQLRRKTAARLVLDFGDALWLPHKGNKRFDDMLALVDAVTTDNELTAAHVRTVQPNCVVIFDCPQIEWFDRRRASRAGRADSTIVIGWVGTPATTFNLYVAWEALERVFSRHDNLHLRLVGADASKVPPFEKVKWSLKAAYSQADMVDEVLDMDIGLFPLQDVEGCRVRGVLKATVYMAGGAAVIASPVGSIEDVIEHGENGILARLPDDWERALEQLITDARMRARLADNGLVLVRDRFRVRQAFARLREVLDPDGQDLPAEERQ